MKTLNAGQMQHVAGGLMPQTIDNKLQAPLKVESSTNIPTGTTAMSFSPSHPEGMRVRLIRFDANFMAPSDSLREDPPLFPGLNDQGGMV